MRNADLITPEEFKQVSENPQISVKYSPCDAEALRTVICSILTQSYVENISDSEVEM